MTNLHLQNVNLTSNTGPNCFGRKLFDALGDKGVTFNVYEEPTATLAFIESTRQPVVGGLYQRLDGIYFNSSENYSEQNRLIKKTYDNATGVIFQSEFNKKLTTHFFGEHPHSIVIHNGANLKQIDELPHNISNIQDRYEKVWCCASHWRPHKRLEENIEYFMKYSGPKDILLIAGEVKNKPIENPRVKYLGNIKYHYLLAILKSCDYFIHLAWLDHCPNVVVDARACGCKIICSSSGGTKEVAGLGATIINEDEWNLAPVKLYEPPKLDFTKQNINEYNISYNMEWVSQKYLDFMISPRTTQ